MIQNEPTASHQHTTPLVFLSELDLISPKIWNIKQASVEKNGIDFMVTTVGPKKLNFFFNIIYIYIDILTQTKIK